MAASKYASLGEFLRGQAGDRVPMTFTEIEALVGPLPPSHRYRAWWSNNATNSVMTRVWREAGFRSEQVDLAGGRLVFRRAAQMTRSEPRHEAVEAVPASMPVYLRERAPSLVPAAPERAGMALDGELMLADRDIEPQEAHRRAAVSERHPRFGALRGLIRVTHGAELEQPVDPEWGERL